jgi:hypothetical protein
MPEALSGLERLDDLIAVDELDGAGVDDAQVARRLAVLDQRELAGGIGTLRGRRGKPFEVAWREAVERRLAGEERCELGGLGQAADSTRAPSTTR